MRNSPDEASVVLEVELPGVASAAEIDVDIDEDTVELCVPERHQLSVSLPEPVDPDAAKARFVKATSTLVLTLPHAPTS